jgi:Flp pilus assembly protein TadG
MGSISRKSRRGSNIIEFALVMPVLFGLLTGIIDYGWTFAVRSAATSAARAGARAGAVTPQTENPDGEALTGATSQWTDMGLPLTPTMVAFRTGTPEVMVVRVRVDLASLVGLVIGPGSVEVTAVQRMEDQP